jgi:hypothetical protein
MGEPARIEQKKNAVVRRGEAAWMHRNGIFLPGRVTFDGSHFEIIRFINSKIENMPCVNGYYLLDSSAFMPKYIYMPNDNRSARLCPIEYLVYGNCLDKNDILEKSAYYYEGVLGWLGKKNTTITPETRRELLVIFSKERELLEKSLKERKRIQLHQRVTDALANLFEAVQKKEVYKPNYRKEGNKFKGIIEMDIADGTCAGLALADIETIAAVLEIRDKRFPRKMNTGLATGLISTDGPQVRNLINIAKEQKICYERLISPSRVNWHYVVRLWGYNEQD